MKFKFIAVREPHDEAASLVVFETVSDISTDEIVTEFEFFMRGVGFDIPDGCALGFIPVDELGPTKSKVLKHNFKFNSADLNEPGESLRETFWTRCSR